MTRNKNRLFGRHFETVQHLEFVYRIVIFYVPFIYGANFIAKFRWESGFPGVPWNPPWEPKGVKVLWSLNPRLTKLFFVTRLTKKGLLQPPSLDYPNRTPYEVLSIHTKMSTIDQGVT